jgi:hypothetical protein
MTPKRESLMLPAVRAYLQQRYDRHTLELPFYEHRIDMYGYSDQTECTVAVELKIRNWRRAVQQALVYQLCSDYVFIALPVATAKRVDLNELRNHGIGLLAVSEGDCVEELAADRSPVLNPNYKAAYMAIVRE